jgi:SAM-dependent methyltransferase
MPLTFTDEPLSHIIAALRERLETLEVGERLTFRALDPDLGVGLFVGEEIELGGVRYRHRPLRAWLELAERLGCRLHLPEGDGVLVTLTFSKLGEASWHGSANPEGERLEAERYGRDSAFSRVQKLEEPTFLLDYTEALERVALGPGSRILSLGTGRGDELIPVETLDEGHTLSVTGIDRAESALEIARERFSGSNYCFLCADLGDLGGLELGRFDLVLSVATFQSPGVQGHLLIRKLVQHHLTARGSLILALPNCRYRDGELIYGAKMKNFAKPDLSLLVKDAAFYKKYLQQHRFQVFITGTYYLFLTAVRI